MSAKHEAQGSKECKCKAEGCIATENASAEYEARGSKATKNASVKPEGAKRPSRPTGLAFFACECEREA